MFPTKFAITKQNAHPQISFCHIMRINKFIQSILPKSLKDLVTNPSKPKWGSFSQFLEINTSWFQHEFQVNSYKDLFESYQWRRSIALQFY